MFFVQIIIRILIYLLDLKAGILSPDHSLFVLQPRKGGLHQ